MFADGNNSHLGQRHFGDLRHYWRDYAGDCELARVNSMSVDNEDLLVAFFILALILLIWAIGMVDGLWIP